MGFWKYSPEPAAYLKHGLRNDVPEKEKFCALLATYGERRLGGHLLDGLSCILLAIVRGLPIETREVLSSALMNLYDLTVPWY